MRRASSSGCHTKPTPSAPRRQFFFFFKSDIIAENIPSIWHPRTAQIAAWPKHLRISAIRQEPIGAVGIYARDNRVMALQFHCLQNPVVTAMGQNASGNAGHPAIPGGNEAGWMKLAQLLGNHSVFLGFSFSLR